MSNTLLDRYEALAVNFVEEREAYKNKPTKASSKRLRAISQQLSNLGSAFRKEMVLADAS